MNGCVRGSFVWCCVFRDIGRTHGKVVDMLDGIGRFALGRKAAAAAGRHGVVLLLCVGWKLQLKRF